ncbi:non-specific lipid-transfer protein 1-like [Lotus japonicus]|uniref:Bifunctional inhibitor/plant lipid transfer protein/seed storage helical domain-containing protein n=1 Tax=Lotus japonicus TaxID=34305 RepID=I3T6G9_LOTJA|nr:non-specific lipid-transfer protein 1-like [Lotus japonicus]AFK48111.1 unknown [Lotus japonicus]
MAVTKVALVAAVMACMLIASSHGEATLTCEQVTVWLTPCISYAVLGGNVSSLCCQGVHSLNAAYKNGDDRRTACQCVKDRAAYILGIDYDRVNQIGHKCGSNCPFKVYPSTDCSKVK